MKLHETDRLLILSCYDFVSVQVHFFILVSDTNNDIPGKKRIKELEIFEQNNTRQDNTTVSQSDYNALGWQLGWKVL